MLQNFGTALSREQMKNVNGGTRTDDSEAVCGCNAGGCICGSTSSCVNHETRTDCIVCNGTTSCA
jgi:hypothetical protein